jgi:hypothetical protein
MKAYKSVVRREDEVIRVIWAGSLSAPLTTGHSCLSLPAGSMIQNPSRKQKQID